MSRTIAFAAAIVAGLVAATMASPLLGSKASAEEFYEGKQITIVIPYGFGGTYGAYSRLIADHLAKHIPGKPNIIVQSMPGAGGIKASNFAHTVMRGDGLNLLMPPDTIVVSQLLRPDKVKYDARDFTWLGSANQTNVIVVVRTDAGVETIEDAETKQVIIGSTGKGSPTFLVPTLLNETIGTKFKVVSGYRGSAKTMLAIEQGEVQGSALNWLAWSSKHPDWFPKGFAKPIVQLGIWKDPDLPDVPMVTELVSEEHKPIAAFMATLGALGRGLVAPPGTPEDKIAILRAAFDKTAEDPAFAADVNKRGLRLIATSGAKLQQVVNDAFKVDEAIVTKARKMLFGDSAS